MPINNIQTLDKLPIGSKANIVKVEGEGALRQHFLDMGLIPGTCVSMVKHAPLGDPVEIRVCSYNLTLRLDDCKNIEINNIKETDNNKHCLNDKCNNCSSCVSCSSCSSCENCLSETRIKKNKNTLHPGLGEDGKYHDKKNQKVLPSNTILTFALCGNQNTGKTTLFNALTGSSQHVGNFPGVTVDRKDGQLIGHKNTLVTDLPGIYSMSPYSQEEIVTRDFIINEKPKCIINIVDATNIERNLNLTLQLLELNIPMVVCLNMIDEVNLNGDSIDINNMENMLGVPVIPISAAKNYGISELIDHALHIAKYQEKPTVQDYCSENEDGGSVHRAIHSIMHLIEDHAKNISVSPRFIATKLIENDKLILDKLNLDKNEIETLEHIVKQMEEERCLDRCAAIADYRFDYIKKVCAFCVSKKEESISNNRSNAIDKILTGKWTAIPAFLIIMGLVFYITFSLVGPALQSILNIGINKFTSYIDILLTNLNINPIIHSLIIDGIFTGVGSILSFLPIIVLLFFFLSMLEDLGYMARIAFIADGFLRKIGLSGRSIVPLLIGFGCSVPGVMASRTMPSKRDRKLTILLIPFMSCTAKLPIYAFFTTFFFGKHSGLIIALLYILGITVGIITALIYKKTLFKGEAVPFVMELPNYRLPSLKNTLILLWEKAKDFLEKAFTIIFLASIIVWFLRTFDTQLNVTQNVSESILAHIAGYFTTIFMPLGLGDFRVVTALFTGFIAKESVVSTIEILFNKKEEFYILFTTASSLSMLVFTLLYTPCIATIAAVKRELGARWALFIIFYQCIIAWIVACLIYNLAKFFV